MNTNPFTNFVHNVKDKFRGHQKIDSHSQQQQEFPDKHLKAGQPCQSNAYLVNQGDFPYWNSGDAFPCMYAGTFNTSLSTDMNHNLFFWMVKNTQLDVTTASPNLIIWINGGPGATSMNGLFLENGPLQVTGTTPDNDDYKVGLRKGSWGDVADVLYLDNPVGTGFSYGDSYVNSVEDAAREFVLFFDQFIRAFPEYQKGTGRNIYLAGESFGGKYLATFSKFIDDHLNTLDIQYNIKGVIMGNPLISPPIQRVMTHQVAQALGVADENNLEQIHTLNKNCQETLGTQWDQADSKCTQVLDYIQDIGGNLFSYDGRIFTYDYQPIAKIYEDLLTNSKSKAQLYKALHIDQSTKTPIFQKKNSKVADAFNLVSMQDSSEWIDQIISIGYDFLIYAGEWDQRDGPVTIESWLKESRRIQMSSTYLWDQPKQIYYIKSGTDYKVGGYYRTDTSNKVTVLVMPKAGHFAPMNQLETTLNFVTDFMSSGSSGLVCHKDKPEDCSTAPIMCKYMNKCNTPNGDCLSNGLCFCNDGFKSADCSEKAELLTASYTKQIITNGTQWKYFYFKNGLLQNMYHELTLSSSFPMDIYISSGWQSDPQEFNYELAFKKQNYIKISSKQFPSLETFVAAIKINGIEHYSTTFHVNTLNVRFDIKVDTAFPNDILKNQTLSSVVHAQSLEQEVPQFEGIFNTYVLGHHNESREERHHFKKGKKNHEGDDWKGKMHHDGPWKQHNNKHDKQFRNHSHDDKSSYYSHTQITQNQNSGTTNKQTPHESIIQKVLNKIKTIHVNVLSIVLFTLAVMMLCMYRIKWQQGTRIEEQIKKGATKVQTESDFAEVQTHILEHPYVQVIVSNEME